VLTGASPLRDSRYAGRDLACLEYSRGVRPGHGVRHPTMRHWITSFQLLMEADIWRGEARSARAVAVPAARSSRGALREWRRPERSGATTARRG
jgi:hypothetical protein